jgi:hypothetical protein
MPACSLAQVDFLGCHVESFTANLGLGGEESSVSINLVPTCANAYTGSLGCLYTFFYGNFAFTGLLSKHDRKINSGSGDTISVILSDGRKVLDNVAVILNKYYCNSVPQPNIINALSILENSVGCGPIGRAGCSDFMTSMTDESGMPIYFALTAINGQSVVCPLCGVVLTIDVSLVLSQATPLYLRLSETSLSVLEIIQRACDNSGFDLTFAIDGLSIRAYPIDRRTNPPPGAVIAQMNAVAPPGTVTDRSFGQTTSFEKSKKFVLGQNIHYFIEINNESGCYQAIAGPASTGVVPVTPTIDMVTPGGGDLNDQYPTVPPFDPD